MIAFQRIARRASTSLGVVARRIAEALIATGGGTVRGDSGGVFLQRLHSKVKKFANEMDDFSLEFLNIAERNFT